MIVGLSAIVIVLAITCLIGAVVLKVAISLANKVFKPEPAGFRRSGRQRPGRDDQSPPNFDSLTDLEPDETPTGSNPFAGLNKAVSKRTPSNTNPYAAPTNYRSPQPTIYPVVRPAIFEPKYGAACRICFVTTLIATIINFVFTAIAPPMQAAFLSIGSGFLVTTILYSLMIPTSFGKAAAIYVFQVLIIIPVAFVLGLAIGAIIVILG